MKELLPIYGMFALVILLIMVFMLGVFFIDGGWASVSYLLKTNYFFIVLFAWIFGCVAIAFINYINK